MKNLPKIEMTQLKLIKCHFVHNPAYQERGGELSAIGVVLKNNGEFLDGDRRAYFTQNFKSNPGPQVPFAMEVEFEAVFTLHTPPLPLERRHFMRLVFPRIVFPYMREFVAETTRRGGFPPLLINHNLFQDDDEDDGEDARGGFDPVAAQVKWTH